MALCVQTFHNNDISIFETSSSCFSDLDVEPYVVTSALTLVYQACSSSFHLISALTLVYQACSSSCYQQVSLQPHILVQTNFLHFVQSEGFLPTCQFQLLTS